jgi:hypothetical protein
MVKSLTSMVHSVSVSSGKFSVTIAARDAIAIHTGALGEGSSGSSPPPTSGTVSVSFSETATTTFGEV